MAKKERRLDPRSVELTAALLGLADGIERLAGDIESRGRGLDVQNRAAELSAEAARLDRKIAQHRPPADAEPPPFAGFPVDRMLDKAMLMLQQLTQEAGGSGLVGADDLRGLARALRVSGDTRWPRWLRQLSPARLAFK